MSSLSFIQWRKKMEWVLLPTVLLIFRSLFVEESQFLRWARVAVSVFAMRPRRGDGQGINYLLPGMYVWPLVGADRGEVYSCLLFLSSQRACSKKHKDIRRQLWYQGSIICALMGCRLLVCLYSEVTILVQVSSVVLQASFYNMVAILLL